MRAVGRPRGISKINAEKTACDRGHEFNEANTVRWTDGRGYVHRQCRRCNNLRAARQYRKRRQAAAS